MAKYTFIYEHEPTPYDGTVESKRTVEFYADSLEQIFSEFESFLRGSGFNFNGVVDIVEEESYEEYREESKWDFSAIPQNNFLFSTVGEDIKLDFGAAQPALDLQLDEESIQIDLSGSQEKCPICKLSKSIMKAEKCYDPECPKTSWLNDLDYKLASEK